MTLPDTIWPRGELGVFEWLSINLAHLCNTRPKLKQLSGAMLRSVGASWVHLCTNRLVHVMGLEHLSALRQPQAVLLATNHRSFFDLYVISCHLLRSTGTQRDIFFPVRAEFFYDRPIGMLVNLVASAMSMYPPVFREPRTRPLNRRSLEQLIDLLRRPNTIVGLHPEGRRNLGEDPYRLLPAQPGVGKLVMEARPAVIPAFINGLSNDFVRQVRDNFSGAGDAINIVFGAPLDLGAFFARRNTLRLQKQVAEHIVAKIAELGAIERRQRRADNLTTLDSRRQPLPRTRPAAASKRPAVL